MSSNEPKSTTQHKRPFSIDLSLELERQLDNESEPSTPAHNAAAKHESLDPHILASIVMQLRQSLSEAVKERDDLVKLLAAAHSQTASLKDGLEHITDKCTTMEEELQAARIKAKDDEEAISMLRSKVEESRRGLMRLQKENRRSSNVPGPIDISRAGVASFTSLGSSKRQSFTPLTGTLAASRGHNRTSSNSDYTGLTAPVHDQSTSPSPNGQVLFSDTASINGHPPVTSRRISGFFGRTSPPNNNGDLAYDPLAAELDGLRRELKAVKDELLESKADLTEALEAKDASEQCVSALRDFIAENNVGVVEKTSLPPLTTTNDVRPGHQPRKSTGWGFNMWKTDPSAKASAEHAPSPIVSPNDSSTPPTATRKFGGLFSSRASIASSVASASSTHPQNNADNSCLSDASSVEDSEPISPTSDSAISGNILVRELSSTSDLSALGTSVGTGTVGVPVGTKEGAIHERMENIALH